MYAHSHEGYYVSNLIWIIKGKENLLLLVQIGPKRKAPFLHVSKFNKGASVCQGAQIYNHCNIVLLPQEMHTYVAVFLVLYTGTDKTVEFE